jgi:hypothetical protein
MIIDFSFVAVVQSTEAFDNDDNDVNKNKTLELNRNKLLHSAFFV